MAVEAFAKQRARIFFKELALRNQDFYNEQFELFTISHQQRPNDSRCFVCTRRCSCRSRTQPTHTTHSRLWPNGPPSP